MAAAVLLCVAVFVALALLLQTSPEQIVGEAESIIRAVESHELEAVQAETKPLLDAIESYRAGNGHYPADLSVVRLLNPSAPLPVNFTEYGAPQYSRELAEGFSLRRCKTLGVLNQRWICVSYPAIARNGGQDQCTSSLTRTPLGAQRRSGNWCIRYGLPPPT
jgi:hypothetical protein